MATSNSFPLTITDVTGERYEKICRPITQYRKHGIVSVGENKIIFPKYFEKYAQLYYNFEFRESDVLIMTYPKCGTTWTQELLWLMRNNLDTKTAKKQPILSRSPFMEADTLMGIVLSNPIMRLLFKMRFSNIEITNPEGAFFSSAKNAKNPRTLKTHLPFSFFQENLLKTCKVVYVARDPRDVLVSFHHHHTLLSGGYNYKGTFEDFFDLFLEGDVESGLYWHHLKEAYERKSDPNLHIMYYEDMKKDILGELTKLNEFVNAGLSDEQLKQVIDYCEFSKMRDRDQMTPPGLASGTKKGFFREGKSGNWKNAVTPELTKRLEEWMKENTKDMPEDFMYKTD